MAQLVSDKRYFLTADKSRAVEEGDPEAATLLVGEGVLIDEVEARKYGLHLDGYQAPTLLEQERAGLASAMERGATEEARFRRVRIADLEAEEAHAAKAQKPAANKAVQVPPDTKAR